MKQSQRIVKNVFADGLAVGVGGVLQVAAVALVARSVGVTQFGTYSFILAFAMFFQLLADSGLSNILIRELARAPERMGEILGAALSLIWLLSIVVFALIVLVVSCLHFPMHVKVLTVLMGASTLAQFHAMGYGSALRSREENDLHAIGFFLHKVIFFVLIVVGLKLGYALPGVVMAHFIPNLFQWAFYRWIVHRRYVHPHMLWHVHTWKYLLTHSAPVGGAAILRLLSQQVDVFVLTWIRDLRTVGLFAGPYRLSLALRFIPQTLSMPLYPMFSRLAHEPGGRPQLEVAYVRSVKFFFIAGLPVTILYAGFAGTMIDLLLGPKYHEALAAMRWIGAAFLPFFVSNPLPFLLTALEDQRFVLWSSVVAITVRIGLDFALIPPCGFVGPCIAFFASEILLLGAMIFRLSRAGFHLPTVEVLLKPLVAAAMMSLVLIPFAHASLPLVAVGATMALAVYAGVLWKSGVFSEAELATAREGLAFVKPLIAKWSKKPAQTQS